MVVLQGIGPWTAPIQLCTVEGMERGPNDERMGKQLDTIGWVTIAVALGLISPALTLVALLVIGLRRLMD